MLKNLEHLNLLKNKKNLLAFSAGVDSSALFFILLQNSIDFDIAIVNYKTREQSDTEVLHAKELCKKYNKNFFTTTCKLNSSNFECQARKARYAFFEDIILKYDYENLILAHQLNDRFEWLMMQLSKGAGASELVGFKSMEKKQNYTLLRPLFNISRDEILEFLETNSLPYFIDESNENEKYKRNEFRKICNPLMQKYKNGIKKSLNYLNEDAKILDGEFYFQKDGLFIYELKNEPINMRLIDKAIKKLGFIMSEKSRKEALKQNVVINRKIAVGKNDKYGFIAPFTQKPMPKDFKEKCRVAKIPPHIRAYLYEKDLFHLLCLK